MAQITVLLADDHTIVRQGLRALLEAEDELRVVGEVGDGRAAVEMADTLSPDVVVMDIAMPGMNGLEATRRIAGTPSGPRVVVLSMYGDVEYVVHALQAGAAAYVLKKDADSELVTAIRAGRTEAPYLSPSIDRRLVEEQLRKSRASAARAEQYDPLTAREREVLQLVAEGRPNKKIATMLGIAVRTVEVHRSNIMRKLGVSDQAGLVRYAVRKGIVSADE